jgi:hypothetical protein
MLVVPDRSGKAIEAVVFYCDVVIIVSVKLV